METFSALLTICAENSPVPGEFPAQRSATRSFDVLFICVWINGWVNNREVGDLRRHRAHCDVIVMSFWNLRGQLSALLLLLLSLSLSLWILLLLLPSIIINTWLFPSKEKPSHGRKSYGHIRSTLLSMAWYTFTPIQGVAYDGKKWQLHWFIRWHKITWTTKQEKILQF